MGVDDRAIWVDDVFSDLIKPFVGTGAQLAHVYSALGGKRSIVQPSDLEVKRMGVTSSPSGTLTNDTARGVTVTFESVNMLLGTNEPRVHRDHGRVRYTDVLEVL